jgi:hypothetical protein
MIYAIVKKVVKPALISVRNFDPFRSFSYKQSVVYSILGRETLPNVDLATWALTAVVTSLIADIVAGNKRNRSTQSK